MRSAFGFGGQKCSANSRVYVERPVHDELDPAARREDRADQGRRPARPRPNWLGPVIDQKAVDRHQQAVARRAATARCSPVASTSTDGDLARGFYVEPTVVGGLPATTACSATSCSRRSRRWRRSTRSTRRWRSPTTSQYGLTAGIYSEDQDEVAAFLDRIQAGVLYVNRRAGATTGAWPGVQAFGGWKGSGSTGKAGLSMYYVGPVPARAEPHDRRLSLSARSRSPASRRSPWPVR